MWLVTWKYKRINNPQTAMAHTKEAAEGIKKFIQSLPYSKMGAHLQPYDIEVKEQEK